MSALIISNVIIHEIKKDQRGVPDVQLSESSIGNDDEQINQVVNSLCDIFTTKSLERATFKNDANFVRDTNKFTNYIFKDSTQDLAINLKKELINATNAKGGFLVFFEHKKTEHASKFFSVFLVRNTNGFIFTESESTYKPSPIEYIDLEHVAMGARVNLTKYLGNSGERYITLVRGNTDIAEYFKKWIGIDKQGLEKTDCKNLLSIANSIHLPPSVRDSDELKRLIGEYAKNSPNKRISLSGLSENLYQDSKVIQKYAENNDIDIDSEFTLKGKYLNLFFKVSVQADGISFSAKREYFDSGKIIIDQGQVIIRSEPLLKKISEQL